VCTSQLPTEDLWVFGYGSLVWRPAFPFLERLPGYICGWARRYWQGSTDHRGVPEAPGRVVTLIPAPQSQCWGIAYRVALEAWERVAANLDHRERGGFDRKRVTVEFRDPERSAVRALVYVATERNPNYLGPASDAEIAAQIRNAHGPSGPNAEYALELAAALRSIEAVDDHVFAIADLLVATV
jgi:cation transport regulator ChaC